MVNKTNKRLIPERRSNNDNRNIEIGLDIYGRDKNGGNNLLPAKDEIFLNDIIQDNLNFKEIFSLTEDSMINNYLIEKSTELYKLHSKTALDLGKIFVEVEEKLSGTNQYDGVYTKWLDRNGFNKMTALRYKRRYKLFKQLKTPIGKNILMTLSQKQIDEISSKEEYEMILFLNLLDEGKNKKDIQNELENNIVQIETLISTNDFDFNKEHKKITQTLEKISINDLNLKKRESLEKDIQRIEKILEKYI